MKDGKRNDEPHWVSAVLGWRGTGDIGRLGLCSAFVIGGFTKLFNFQAAVAEQAHFGLHPAWLWAVMAILVELVGPILLLSGRFVWLGAGALGVLTTVAAIVANPFWTMHDDARIRAMNTFFEHMGLISGFIMAAVLSRASRADVRLSASQAPIPSAPTLDS